MERRYVIESQIQLLLLSWFPWKWKLFFMLSLYFDSLSYRALWRRLATFMFAFSVCLRLLCWPQLIVNPSFCRCGNLCISADFMHLNWVLVSLERIYRRFFIQLDTKLFKLSFCHNWFRLFVVKMKLDHLVHPLFIIAQSLILCGNVPIRLLWWGLVVFEMFFCWNRFIFICRFH